ncbi:hypothetical protein BJF78_11050 [Pseudonocardia sp. CNS-139]|nr:hypothetical protein BJF78_11050 [Pseudonocardia sp. CNS-139]
MCAVGLAGLAAAFAGVEGPVPFDTWADGIVIALFGDDRQVLRPLVRLGSPAWIPPFLVAIVLVSLALRRPRVALANVLGLAVTAGAVTVLQPTIGRLLETGYALPSGHTAGAVAFVAGTSLLAMSLAGRWPVAVGAGTAAALAGTAAVLGVSLVANGLHYTSDILAGVCTAIIAMYGSALLVDRLAERRSRE